MTIDELINSFDPASRMEHPDDASRSSHRSSQCVQSDIQYRCAKYKRRFHRSAQRLIDANVSVQTGMLGANDIFYGSTLLFLLLIGFIWLSQPGKANKALDAGGAH